MTVFASRIPTFFIVSLGLHLLGIFLLVGLSKDYETLAMPKGGVLITLGTRPQLAAPPLVEPAPDPEPEPLPKEPEPTPLITPKVIQKKALIEQQVVVPEPVQKPPKKIEKPPKPVSKPIPKPTPKPKPVLKTKTPPKKPLEPELEKPIQKPQESLNATLQKPVQTGSDSQSQQINPQAGAPAQQAGRAQGSASGSAALSTYRALISEKLAKNKEYPRRAKIRKQEGTVIITFILAADGSLLDLYISQTSGYSLLDEATLKMVRKSAPFDAFPKSYTDKTLIFKYPVSYFFK